MTVMNTMDKHKLIKLSVRTNKALEVITGNKELILNFTSMDSQQTKFNYRCN
jgi:hypothetical protein